MGLGEAARALMAFRFGPPGEEACRGALLLAAVALGARPELPEIVSVETVADQPIW